jgi:hypothetical protein
MKKIFLRVSVLVILFALISYNTEAMVIFNLDDMDEVMDSKQMFPTTSEFLYGIIFVKGFTFMGRTPDDMNEIYFTKVDNIFKKPQQFNYKFNDFYYDLVVLKHKSFTGLADIERDISENISVYTNEFHWLKDENDFKRKSLENGEVLFIPSEHNPSMYISFVYYKDDFIYSFYVKNENEYFTEEDVMTLISSMRVKD